MTGDAAKRRGKMIDNPDIGNPRMGNGAASNFASGRAHPMTLSNSEGQTPAQSNVGGTIAEPAQASGKWIAYLVSSNEVMAA